MVGFYGEDVFHDVENICLISRDEEIHLMWRFLAWILWSEQLRDMG